MNLVTPGTSVQKSCFLNVKKLEESKLVMTERRKSMRLRNRLSFSAAIGDEIENSYEMEKLIIEG